MEAIVSSHPYMTAFMIWFNVIEFKYDHIVCDIAK